MVDSYFVDNLYCLPSTVLTGGSETAVIDSELPSDLEDTLAGISDGRIARLRF